MSKLRRIERKLIFEEKIFILIQVLQAQTCMLNRLLVNWCCLVNLLNGISVI